MVGTMQKHLKIEEVNISLEMLERLLIKEESKKSKHNYRRKSQKHFEGPFNSSTTVKNNNYLQSA
jgi:hypothetical protein